MSGETDSLSPQETDSLSSQQSRDGIEGQIKYSDDRRRLYTRMFEEYNSQYINYYKYFTASEYIGKKGQYADYAVTLVASWLLILISGILGPDQSNNSGLLLLMSALTAGLSYASIVGNWQSVSDQLYKSGQIHHDLYMEFEKFIKEELPDPDADQEELEERAERLLKRKSELNRATKRISSKWYQRLKMKKDIEWDRPQLEEIRQGNTKFKGEDPEMGSVKRWLRENIIWVFF